MEPPRSVQELLLDLPIAQQILKEENSSRATCLALASRHVIYVRSMCAEVETDDVTVPSVRAMRAICEAMEGCALCDEARCTEASRRLADLGRTYGVVMP